MMSRRVFAGCAICAVTGFIATDASAAETTPPSRSRRIISQTDGPMPGYVTIIMEVTFVANGMSPRHYHPGIESAYIVSGGGTISIDGKPDFTAKPGAGYQVPMRAVHSFKSDEAPTVSVITYIVEKDQPLSTQV